MSNTIKGILGTVVGLLIIALLSVNWYKNAYNAFQTHDEAVTASWSKVLNVYKKRSDLVPNLANTIERVAKQETDVVVGAIRARAAATSVTLPADATPDQLQKFADAQASLSQGLGRLMAVSENYPQLKTDANFLQLQKDLKDIESQAAMARNDYIRQVQAYNVNVRSFPTNWVATNHGYKVKPELKFDDVKEIQQAPVVFGNKKS